MKSINYIDIAKKLGKSNTDFSNEEKIFEEIWQVSKGFNFPETDMQGAKSKLFKKLDFDSSPIKKLSIWKKPSSYLVAASILFIIITAGILILKNAGSQNYYCKAGKTQTIKLADGSEVLLYGNSHLTVDKNFNSSNRDIQLNGAALFNVKHGLNLPFIVSADHTKITVIGTSFSLSNRKETKHFSIKVWQGIVDVFNQEGHQKVYAGMEINTAEETALFETKKTKDSSKYLAFENTAIEDIIFELESIYGIKLSYDIKLNNTKISIRTKATNINDVLKILSETLENPIVIKK